MTNFDLTHERLRERVTEPRSDYDHGYCLNCCAQLTIADVENEECSQCGSSLTSDDEDLYDYDWDGYQHGE